MKRQVVDTVCELTPEMFLRRDLDGQGWTGSPVLECAEFKPKSVLEEIVKKELSPAWTELVKEHPGYPKYHTAVKSIELPFYGKAKDAS